MHQTPWKKSRTFGDLHGGRTRRRWTDNIVARTHSLPRPGPDDALPFLIEENPSRRFVFPVSVATCAEALRRLPPDHTEGLTHLWLRALPARLVVPETPWALYVLGSGVRAIVLHPWGKDGRRWIETRPPSPTLQASFRRFGGRMVRTRSGWDAVFPDPHDLARFYLEHLLGHEVGHHVAWYVQGLRQNTRQAEDFADDYPRRWGPVLSAVLNG